MRREYAEAQWRKAEALARRGEFEHALEDARTAVKLGQPSPEHDAMLGWLILQHANGAKHVHQHVFRCLDRAFKRDPLCEQVLYYKGLVLNLLGETEQAQAHFQRVLMLKPQHADAAREVRIYEMRKTHARTESGFLRRLLTGKPKAE
jgi:tetratricopeptide (TPR) repeat protein